MFSRFQRSCTSSGFTLIELLVVASIISLLASIMLVAVDSARQKARLAAVKADIRTLFTEAELYYSSNGGYISAGFSGVCGSAGGFLQSPQAAAALQQISNLSRVSLSAGKFHCNIQPTAWSLALDISNLTNKDEVLCASTFDGRMLTLGNSNDTSPQAFIISNQCLTPW